MEGLFTQVLDDLKSRVFQGDTEGKGDDSLCSEEKNTWKTFFEGLDSAIKDEKLSGNQLGHRTKVWRLHYG